MEKIKEKLRMLVKPIEFAVMIGLFVIGCVFGAITFKWAVILSVAYVVLQLTGWGVRNVQDAIDEGKEVVEGVKEEVEKVTKK